MDARLAPKRLLVLPINPVFERYSRQILFAGMGEEGQRKLLASSAVIVGCGAIGASAAQLLARAGVDGIEARQFRRYGSARQLYNFKIDNAAAY